MVFVTPIIMLKSGVINACLYKHTFSNSISSTWGNEKSVFTLNGASDRFSLPDVPVIVIYKTITAGDLNAENPVRVDISDKDLGKLWSPFITKSDYNFPVSFIYKHQIDSDSLAGQMTINAEIKVSGHYKFTGFYSKEISTKLVAEKVLNDIYKDIKKNLHKISLQSLNGK